MEQTASRPGGVLRFVIQVVDHVMNPPAPRLHNTDGKEIAFHRLFFEIDSPRRALDA